MNSQERRIALNILANQIIMMEAIAQILIDPPGLSNDRRAQIWRALARNQGSTQAVYDEVVKET